MAPRRITALHSGVTRMLDVLYVFAGAAILAGLAAYAVALNRL